ncbi:MAG TPA: ABC transporter permease, partial [Acetobacteraceae bacterium]|nr:ABC transporter permease [Acetobacteraceae bacterium]
MTPILLSWPDIGIAASLLLVDGVLSLALGLRLHRQLGVAATRMVLQLVAIGFVLRAVFRLASPWVTLAVLLVMAAV